MPADSRASHLALIELTARAIHRIAVLLFQLDDTCHKGEDLVGERPDSCSDRTVPPTPFIACSYQFVGQYPDGVADLVGYWAEDQIFGGVVLFERLGGDDQVRTESFSSHLATGFPQARPFGWRFSESSQYKDVWFHSHRFEITTRPYALTEDQRTSLVRLLRAERPIDNSVLPILGDGNNRLRVDAEIAIPEYGIYRDKWEREIQRCDYFDYLRRRRDVISTLDYPEYAGDLGI